MLQADIKSGKQYLNTTNSI